MESEPKQSPGYHSKRWYKRHPEGKVPKQEAPARPDLPEIPKTPLPQSTLLWGSGSLFVTIVLTAVAGMTKDLRWLLWLAFPFGVLASWEFLGYLAIGKRAVLTLVASIAVAVGLLLIRRFLPAPVAERVTTVAPVTIMTAKQPDKEIVEQHETASNVVAKKHSPKKLKKATPEPPVASDCGKDVTIGVLGGSFHDNGAVVRNYLPCANIQMKGIEASSNRDGVLINGGPPPTQLIPSLNHPDLK